MNLPLDRGPMRRCKEQLHRRYPKVHLNKMEISSVVTRFRAAGSVQDKKNCGQPRPSVLTVEKLQDVWVQQSPRKSTRKLTLQVYISYSSTQRNVGKIHLRPYRIRAVQELKGPGIAKRLQYCRWFRSLVEEDGINMLVTKRASTLMDT
jgi:hypothetical protein